MPEAVREAVAELSPAACSGLVDSFGIPDHLVAAPIAGDWWVWSGPGLVWSLPGLVVCWSSRGSVLSLGVAWSSARRCIVSRVQRGGGAGL